MLTFSPDTRASQLIVLPFWKQVVIAASAAGRILPCYEYYCHAEGKSDSHVLVEGLEYAWSTLRGVTDGEGSSVYFHKAIYDVIPEPGGTTEYDVRKWCAEEAAFGALHVIRLIIDRDHMNAVWACNNAVEAVAFYVRYANNRELAFAGFEQHLIVQRELQRQERDILQVTSAPHEINEQIIDILKTRSNQERGVDAGEAV
jgi:uncharacterized protein YjaG (DUF416 family)